MSAWHILQYRRVANGCGRGVQWLAMSRSDIANSFSGTSEAIRANAQLELSVLTARKDDGAHPARTVMGEAEVLHIGWSCENCQFIDWPGSL